MPKSPKQPPSAKLRPSQNPIKRVSLWQDPQVWQDLRDDVISGAGGLTATSPGYENAKYGTICRLLENMPAGDGLNLMCEDVVVAHWKVMGIYVQPLGSYRFSANMTDAWKLVDWIRGMNWGVLNEYNKGQYTRMTLRDNVRDVKICFQGAGIGEAKAKSNQLPLALCRAAMLYIWVANRTQADMLFKASQAKKTESNRIAADFGEGPFDD